MSTHRLTLIALIVVLVVLNQTALLNSTGCKRYAESWGRKVARMCYNSEVTGWRLNLDTYESATSSHTSCMCTLTVLRHPSADVIVYHIPSLSPESPSCGSQITYTIPPSITDTWRCNDTFIKSYTLKTMTITWSINDHKAAAPNSDYCLYLQAARLGSSRFLMTLKCVAPVYNNVTSTMNSTTSKPLSTPNSSSSSLLTSSLTTHRYIETTKPLSTTRATTINTQGQQTTVRNDDVVTSEYQSTTSEGTTMYPSSTVPDICSCCTMETLAIKEYLVVAIVVPIVTSILLQVIATTGNILFYRRTRESHNLRRHQINRPVDNEPYDDIIAITQRRGSAYEVTNI